MGLWEPLQALRSHGDQMRVPRAHSMPETAGLNDSEDKATLSVAERTIVFRV